MTDAWLIAELWALTGLAVLAAAFFAAAESIITGVDRQALRLRAERGDPAARRADTLLEETGPLLHMTRAGHILCLILMSLLLWRLSDLHWPAASPGAKALGCTGAAVSLAATLGLLAPKALGWRGANRGIHHIARPLGWMWAVVRPLEHTATALVGSVARLAGGRRWSAGEPLSKNQVLEMLEQAEDEGGLERSERQMIHRILNLHRTLAREVMRPLIRMVAIAEKELSQERLAELARSSGHSRFPVYRDMIINVIGHIDIYEALAGEPKSPAQLRAMIHPPHFVPEVKRVDDLLQEMLRERLRAAIVIDEHGACSGWVTREDILEEIFGQIADEFDRERPQWTVGPDGVLTVEAATDLDDLNAHFGLAIPKTHCDTLGGFLYERLGRVPRAGESVRHGGHTLRVVEMNAQQIVRIRLEPAEPDAQ